MEKGLERRVISMINSNGRENERSIENASKHDVESDRSN